MTLKSLLYLAQLEEYDIMRIQKWLKDNPNRTVNEIKGHLVWTFKTRLIYLKAYFLSLVLSPEKSLILVLRFLQPIDNFIKKVFILISYTKFHILNSKCLVIGITGSWGKTTTKDRLHQLLKDKYITKATTGNRNTLLAIAKQLLFIPSSTQIFICEMGAYQVGDIKAICNLVHPDIGIITAIGPMHLERFGSLENIKKGKLELIDSLSPKGLAILPKSLKSEIKTKCPTKYFLNSSTIVKYIAKHFALSHKNALDAIKDAPITGHRQEITQNNGLTIIDDSYNSNPHGFKIALLKLKKIKTTNRTLITPGMIELGDLQYQENSKIAAFAKNICQHIIVVGFTNRPAWADTLKNAKNIHYVDTLKQAQDLLPRLATPGSALLFENDLPDNYF